MIEQWPLPDGRRVKIPGIVPKLSETPGETRWLGPTLGEHTAEVLSRLGYDPERQRALRERGVI
jgi:formyl-CoA transferase